MDNFDSLLKTLFAMAWMVEARDPYTGGHLWRVSQFARRTAEVAGLPQGDVMRIMLGGFLHDLGKIGVPDAILRKPDKLTEEEYAVIKTHPEVGQRILANHPLRSLVEAAVRMHHERPDGRGYPAGLALEHIPVDARIVGICDAFDAMTSSRPYRQGMPIDKALGIIRENLDSQFDRYFGEHFLSLERHNQLTDIVGHSEPGIPLETCPSCGPIITRTRHHHAGDHLYCPNCTSEVVLHLERGQARIEATGRKGTPDQLIPALNLELCEALIQEAEVVMPGSKVAPVPWWRRWQRNE